MVYESDNTMNEFSTVLKASHSHLAQIQPLAEYVGNKLSR